MILKSNYRPHFLPLGTLLGVLGVSVVYSLNFVLLAASNAAPPPATQPEAVLDAQAAQWLEKIEKRAGEIKTLQAQVINEQVNGLLGSKQRWTGRLVYAAGPPAAKFAAHFDKLIADGRAEALDHWYIFDGSYFVEKSQEKDGVRTIKRFSKTQVVAPDAPPDSADPLALGKGPFSVPVNMKKDVVNGRFVVTVLTDDKPEKVLENTVHLKLVPRPGQRIEATEIHLWYDRDPAKLWPVRSKTINKNNETTTTITLSEHKVNEPVDEKVIDVTPPKQADGWEIEIKPWKN